MTNPQSAIFERKMSKPTQTEACNAINTEKLHKLTLIPVDVSFGLVKARKAKVRSVIETIAREQKRYCSDTTILFAVRNPSCASCMEHAMQVAELIESDGKINAFAVIKETGVDDPTLIKFHQDYFGRNPIYQDPNWNVYNVMGGHKLGILSVFKNAVPLMRRKSAKGIDGPMMPKG